MGFNKRYINSENCIQALNDNNLKGYYGKSDMLIFDNSLSSLIHELFLQGKSDKEILIIIKPNMEEKTYEVY
jgi:hypothetical protein